MQRLPALLLLSLAVSSVAACAEDPELEAVSAAEQTATRLELKCVSGAKTFDVSPGTAGALEGKLTADGTTKLFNCAPAAGTDPTLVASCDERVEGTAQAGWNVVISKAGSAFTATAQVAGVAPVTFSCVVPPPRPTVSPYTVIAPLIAQKCSGCHRTTFATLQKVKQRRSGMISKVSSGLMPRGQPTWFQTADGKELLDFLRNSPELD